jgi:hypothetical protein
MQVGPQVAEQAGDESSIHDGCGNIRGMVLNALSAAEL